MYDLLKTIRSLLSVGWSWLVLTTPIWRLVYSRRKPGYAFLVHPRKWEDCLRPLPVFRWLPKRLAERICRRLSVIVLAKMKTPRALNGVFPRMYLTSTFATPRVLASRKEKERVRRDFARMLVLLYRMNVRTVGLGAWIPGCTENGRELAEQCDRLGLVGMKVTTGHARTVACIRNILTGLMSLRHEGAQSVRVGVVGAAGSVGRLTSKVLADLGHFRGTRIDMHLVELKAREKELGECVRDILHAHAARSFNRELGSHRVTSSTTLESLKTQGCDYVVVVTNALGAIIHQEHLKENAVVIEDAQPRNVGERVPLVVDVLDEVDGFNARFGFGQDHRESGIVPGKPAIVFTCLGEVAAIALSGEPLEDHRVGYLDLDAVVATDATESMLRLGGIQTGPPQWVSFENPLGGSKLNMLIRHQHVPLRLPLGDSEDEATAVA